MTATPCSGIGHPQLHPVAFPHVTPVRALEKAADQAQGQGVTLDLLDRLFHMFVGSMHTQAAQ
jgi:hypothetical protein